MPELPEVETIVRGLRSRVLNCHITTAKLLRPDILKSLGHTAEDFTRFLRGRHFQEIERRGKYIVFTLNHGGRMIAHLGMTGKFVLSRQSQPQPDHLCSVYHFERGLRLDHVDVRRFGQLAIYQPGEAIPELEKLGADPISTQFSAESLQGLVRGKNDDKPRRRAIHTLLLDQTIISGVGNIYASEALHRAGIRPDTIAGSLGISDLQRLAAELQNVMTEAIKQGGTTVNDYRTIDDKPGLFLEYLRVYERKDQPCRACGTEIVRLRLGGRSAYYCPKCQPKIDNELSR
ncbi:MAG: bifunctional DNA-formamidopyrimidine glycosylase/DNA-(apurinic or apyrimidinic site) lyase [bacterium]|nr:bifunctional DNA-formamidopyrimidine glycosylase/DNA-(apurinic or apyrimidinic site) lyase [bacterium]